MTYTSIRTGSVELATEPAYSTDESILISLHLYTQPVYVMSRIGTVRGHFFKRSLY